MYVDLVDEEDASEAIAEILQKKRQGGRDLGHIRVQLVLPLRQLTRESLRYFFDCTRAEWSETPVELYIISSSGRHLTRTDELAFILEHAPNLHHLEIDGVSLIGNNIENLAQALTSQQQLRTVYLYSLQHIDFNADLGPLATALCKLPKLKALELYHVRFSQRPFGNQRSLESVARWSKAKTLAVMLPCVAHDLQETGLAVTEGLCENQTLERISLVTGIFPKPIMFHDSVISSIARALQSNRTRLRELELNISKDISLLPLAEALKTNTTLHTLSLCWDTCSIAPGGKNLTALRRVLRDHNFTLQKLDILLKNRQGIIEREWTDRELDFCLLLNQVGRQSLIARQQERSTTPPEDWIQILSKCNNEVSASFYFLSMNPPLCSGGPTQKVKRSSIPPVDTRPQKRRCCSGSF